MKQNFEDDGRTVANMDVEGMPQGFSRFRIKKNNKGSDLTKKERRKLIRAYFSLYMPRLVCIVAGLGITFVLLWFWLK